MKTRIYSLTDAIGKTIAGERNDTFGQRCIVTFTDGTYIILSAVHKFGEICFTEREDNVSIGEFWKKSVIEDLEIVSEHEWQERDYLE